MPRPQPDYRAIHAEADRFEPRLARAVAKALGKIRDRLPLSALEAGLRRAAATVEDRTPTERRILAKTLGRKLALALLSREAVEDALTAAGHIKADVVRRGSKLGAAQVRGGR